jgi:hypothetical protein
MKRVLGETAARGGAVGPLALVLSALSLGLLGLVPSAEARDINLGGHRTETQGSANPNQHRYQLPPNVVALPRVVASVREKSTGRWKRVLVDAYVVPTDAYTREKMRGLSQDIAKRLRPQLEAQSAESLQAAYQGSKAARLCIHEAAAQSLGRGWDGEVYIRSLAVF